MFARMLEISSIKVPGKHRTFDYASLKYSMIRPLQLAGTRMLL